MIFKKLNTLRKGIQTKGFLGFFRYFLFESDNDFVGRYVELRGNRVRIENLTISVNSPAVPRRNKSQLIQGRYEQPERNAIKTYLPRDKPVIELGGSIGVVACMTNQLLHHPHEHVVVEANPNMVNTLEHNRQINQCQFDIIQRAIAYDRDRVAFYQSGFSSSIVAVSEAQIEVPTIRLGDIVATKNWQIFSLICDIEGAEVDVIAHELELLRNRVMMIIIELHPNIVGVATVDNMLTQLDSIGFEKVSQENDVYVFRNTAITA